MLTTLGFAAGASLPLVAGAIVGVLWRPPQWLVAVALAFAGGAVLASVIDTLAPEAFGEGGPFVALASAAGFFTAFVLSA